MSKPKHPSSLRSIRRLNILATVLISIGLALCTAAVALYVYNKSLSPNPQPPSAVSTPRAALSSKKPSSEDISRFEVSPADPKYIAISSIGVSKTRVFQLGLTKDKSIAAPANIYDTGWYKNSARPGQLGAMFIYGHISSWTANGIFYNLKNIKSGDKIIVTRGDDKQFIYQVVAKKVYQQDKVDMDRVLSPIDPNRAGLNLMTCAGKIIKGTSEFSQRLVVFTTLVSS